MRPSFLAHLLAAVLAASLAAPARAGDVPDDAVVATLAFGQAPEPNRILLDLAPEGARAFPLWLDTGASFSVLTPLAARAIGVSVRRLKQDPYRRATRLGRDLQFFVDARSSDTGARTSWEYGLLGGNFLQEYVVEIDFTMRTVRFLDPARYQVPAEGEGAGEAVVPITLTSSRPVVEVELDGRPLRLLVDTGAHVGLILSGAAARAVGIDDRTLPEVGTFRTTLGPMQVRFTEVGALALGGLAVGPVPTFVSPRGWYNIAGETDSVLGYDVLSRFLVRIDYPRKRLWLRRESHEVPFLGADYASMRAAGALVREDALGEIFVLAVHAGGVAERRGVRRGDQLLRDGPGGRRLSVPETLDRLAGAASVRVVRDEAGVPIEQVLAPLAGEAPPAP